MNFSQKNTSAFPVRERIDRALQRADDDEVESPSVDQPCPRACTNDIKCDPEPRRLIA